MKPRKYTFHVARAKGSERSYTKTENQLMDNEINLLAANHLNEFNKLPVKAKELVINKMFEYLMWKDKNDLQEQQSGDNDLLESESTVSDTHQGT